MKTSMAVPASESFALLVVLHIIFLLRPCLSFNLPHWRNVRRTSLLVSTTSPPSITIRARCLPPARRGRTWVMGQRSSSSFRTEVEVIPWPSHTHVGYDDSFFLLGSCFSENIGKRLARQKLQSTVNPSHGLLFSPLSAAASLDRMVSGVLYDDGEPGVVLSEGTGLWSSLDHHSSYSATSRQEAAASALVLLHSVPQQTVQCIWCVNATSIAASIILR